MTPKIDSQLTQLHSLRRSRRPHGPWSTSITDPHPHMLSRFWKRRIAMLARAPYRNPQSSFFHTLTFALFAIAIFALPMLNIVPVRTLLARDDKPAATSEPEPSESDFSKPTLPEKEEEEEIQNRSAPPAGATDPAAIEEEDIEIKKITETPKTVAPTEKPNGESDDDSKAPLADPAKPVRKIPRGKRGFSGIVANEEEETTLHKSSPPQPEYLPEPTGTEKEILSKLSNQLDFPFDVQQETLQGVIDLLKVRLKLAILPDLKAIEAEGISLDVPDFTLAVSDVKVENLLRLLLEQKNLTYSIEDGVLKITTKTALQQRQRLYIYPLADLVQSREDLDEILDAVENTLRVRGMTGVFSINASTRSLIATHSYTSHQEVLNLLRGLRQVAALTSDKPLAQESNWVHRTYDDSNSTIRSNEREDDDDRGRGGRRRVGLGGRIGSSTRVIEAPGGSGNFKPRTTETQIPKTTPSEKPATNDEGLPKSDAPEYP